ncbi:MAG: hypothetical protein ACO20U_06280 [Candidatus Planktophila sp.]
MRPTPYVASLRIYEPLSAFDPVDRLRWQSIDSSIDSRRTEQELALRRVVFPEPPAGRPDGAHVLDINDVRYVSPWSTATRCWAALDDFKDSLPSSITPFFVPQSLEEVITTGVDLLEDRVPHIITETWVIPPRWFSLFIPEERVRGEDEDGIYSFARTTMAKASERATRSHEIVLGAFGQGSVEQEIENLLDWLELFHPESLVELDYGGLANYLDNVLRAQGLDGIDDDSSIEDVAHSLAGLAAGDGAVAGQGYERLVTRWRSVQAIESAM